MLGPSLADKSADLKALNLVVVTVFQKDDRLAPQTVVVMEP